MMRAGDSGCTIQVVVRAIDASVTIRGELDVAAAIRLRDVIGAIGAVPGVLRVRIDGRAIDFVDSAGLRGLLLSRADSQRAGVPWCLDSASPALRRLLDLAASPELLSNPGVN